jgi:hypothetical protein
LLHADARLYAGLFDGGEQADLALDPKRKSYVHLVRGELEVNGRKLAGGDAAMLEGESQLRLAGGKDAEVLVTWLPEARRVPSFLFLSFSIQGVFRCLPTAPPPSPTATPPRRPPPARCRTPWPWSAAS